MKLNALILLLVMAFATTGCEQKKLKDAVVSPQPAAPGRDETRSLEVYKPIGVDGKEVRAKVDQLLNENDKRVENLDKQIDQSAK